ncbi:MAG: Mov34/MPN/PAD-1 family protein [Nitrosomonas sp.]|nr:Mov34/MPN/PAD-1 family protein [Nitrosomonas sp.]
MLTIHSRLINALITQALNFHPIETCGIIAGPVGSNLPLRIISMHKETQPGSFPKLNPQRQLQVWKEMNERGEEPIVIFFSHPHCQAYPTHAEVESAIAPQSHYLIVSTESLNCDELRSFRIIDRIVIEERIQIVHRYEPELELQMVA